MKALAIGLLSLCLCACASISFNREYVKSPLSQNTRYQHLLLFGFINLSEPIQPEKICPNQDWVQVKSEWGVLSVATTILTGFLYSPVEVQILCLKKSS